MTAPPPVPRIPPPPPEQAPYGYPVAAPSGRMSWALGFLAFVPIPYVSLIGAAIAMWATYPSRSRHPLALVRDNARNAANWAITVLLGVVLCAIWMIVTGTMEWARTGGFFPIGGGIVAFFALSIVHVIVTIAGTVASGTRVFRGPGIPFLRQRGGA